MGRRFRPPYDGYLCGLFRALCLVAAQCFWFSAHIRIPAHAHSGFEMGTVSNPFGRATIDVGRGRGMLNISYFARVRPLSARDVLPGQYLEFANSSLQTVLLPIRERSSNEVVGFLGGSSRVSGRDNQNNRRDNGGQ
jgi:hypothetical protein